MHKTAHCIQRLQRISHKNYVPVIPALQIENDIEGLHIFAVCTTREYVCWVVKLVNHSDRVVLTMLYWPLFVVAALFVIVHRVPAQNAKFWNDQAQDTLQKALSRQATLNRNVAKNVVLLMGDGMGIPTITAARILKGQKAGMPGEETVLAWEDFPSVALSKVYTRICCLSLIYR